jgi:hypothetical protein
MIEKMIKKRNLHDESLIREDRDFWMKQTPDERLNAVEFLRKPIFMLNIPKDFREFIQFLNEK